LLDNNKELYVPEIGKVCIFLVCFYFKRPWNVIHISCYLPHKIQLEQTMGFCLNFIFFLFKYFIYSKGRKFLSKALRNRFIEIQFDTLPKEELLTIISCRTNLGFIHFIFFFLM
jgi:hypothetical protein